MHRVRALQRRSEPPVKNEPPTESLTAQKLERARQKLRIQLLQNEIDSLPDSAFNILPEPERDNVRKPPKLKKLKPLPNVRGNRENSSPSSPRNLLRTRSQSTVPTYHHLRGSPSSVTSTSQASSSTSLSPRRLDLLHLKDRRPPAASPVSPTALDMSPNSQESGSSPPINISPLPQISPQLRLTKSLPNARAYLTQGLRQMQRESSGTLTTEGSDVDVDVVGDDDDEDLSI